MIIVKRATKSALIYILAGYFIIVTFDANALFICICAVQIYGVYIIFFYLHMLRSRLRETTRKELLNKTYFPDTYEHRLLCKENNYATTNYPSYNSRFAQSEIEETVIKAEEDLMKKILSSSPEYIEAYDSYTFYFDNHAHKYLPRPPGTARWTIFIYKSVYYLIQSTVFLATSCIIYIIFPQKILIKRWIYSKQILVPFRLLKISIQSFNLYTYPLVVIAVIMGVWFIMKSIEYSTLITMDSKTFHPAHFFFRDAFSTIPRYAKTKDD